CTLVVNPQHATRPRLILYWKLTSPSGSSRIGKDSSLTFGPICVIFGSQVQRDKVNRPKFIDLFCGIGGLRLAFESVGAQCVFSSDWDKYAQITYEANFGEKPYGDL